MKRFCVWFTPNGNFAFIGECGFRGWQKYSKRGYYTTAVILAEDYYHAYGVWHCRRDATGRAA